MDDANSNGSPAKAEVWKRALDLVVPCCVVLKVTQTRAFDTEAATSSYATGFIVDKERGLILTNRHVVTPGPIVAEAIFLNREEVPVYPLYYDPVHDFGFLRFDPSKLQFMAVSEVPLAPDAASVGLDIRVVGNDSGEKVSILAGTLARLDRDAPNYGRKGYNDFNTFYFQAASGTKGGSSGSPVIDIQGRAVALNAGGRNKAATAYYLPLERIVRTLKLIQAANPPGTPWKAPSIPRGDLQTTFTFKGFDEVRRLGLRGESEVEVRASRTQSHGSEPPEAPTGMLVVDGVVPGSPADDVLEAGDILVKVGRRVVTHFLLLEEILDATVGKTIALELERGGTQHRVDLPVTDLHSVTPNCFLEMAAGSLNALSYQQARNNRAMVGQVYVAEPGYVLGRGMVPKHSIITSLNSLPTPTLESFAAILKTLPHGTRAPLEYFTFSERQLKKNTILHIDQQWYGPPVFWSRDDAAGCWHHTDDYPPPAAVLPPPTSNGDAGDEMHTTDDMAVDDCIMDVDEPVSTDPHEVDEREEQLRRCMCLVEVDIPLVALSDGVHARSFAGNGLVVYHGESVGLVLTDRNTVAIGCADVNISFGAHPSEIVGIIRFLHPLHNFALVSYNPHDLPEAARSCIAAAPLLAYPPLRRGETVNLAGLTKSMRVLQRKCIVTNSTSSVTIAAAEVPRFRAVHEEVVKVDQDFGSAFSGVLTDDAGCVRAMWGSYSEQVEKEEREWCAGLHTAAFAPWVERLKRLETCPLMPPPVVRTFDAELEAVLLSKAAQFGLPASWVDLLERADPDRRQVLRIRSCIAQSHASKVLQPGDMLLAVANRPVTCFLDLEKIISNPLLLPSTSGHSPEIKRPAKRLKSGTEDGDTVQQQQQQQNGGEEGHVPQVVEPTPPDTSTTDGGIDLEPQIRPPQDPSADQEAACSRSIPLTVYRGRSIHRLTVQVGQEDGLGTARLVHWCGAQLQPPHRAVKELGFLPEQGSGVYISRWHHGSPSHRYGLYALHWIVEINRTPTPTLDAFIEAVREMRDGDFVRVKMCHLETTQTKVLTLKMDTKYWPTWELRLDPSTCTWRRHCITPCTGAEGGKRPPSVMMAEAPQCNDGGSPPVS